MKNAISIYSLFEKIAGDDPRVFQTFFDYTYSKVYRYANYFIYDPDLCKDIVSDVYTYIWLNRHKLRDVKDYENYLFVCVRNRALNYLKSISKYQQVRLDDIDSLRLSDGENPERKMLDGELKTIVELAINALPERCRLIFFMIREEEMKYKEVAEALSISERTVQAQMCIALKRIGLAVKEYMGNLKK